MDNPFRQLVLHLTVLLIHIISLHHEDDIIINTFNITYVYEPYVWCIYKTIVSKLTVDSCNVVSALRHAQENIRCFCKM